MSFYRYLPQSLTDVRDIIDVPREKFLSVNFVESLLHSTPEGHELSIHSTISLAGGQIRHLPMVDMSTSARAHLEKLDPFIHEILREDIAWFASGRSFHGYGHELINSKQWVSFMGLLLLSNRKDMKPTVDPRWIGHRLVAGYSALRWTRNTDYYRSEPLSLNRDERT